MGSFDYIGWFGTFLYLANYAYLAFCSEWNRSVYFTANAIAAISLVISSFAIASWQAVGINFFWAFISLWLLFGKGFQFVSVSPRILNSITLGFWLLALAALVVDLPLSVSVLGWSSTFAFSASYLLFAAKTLPIGSYHIWNAYAAFVLLPQLYFDNNWPVLAMEICWLFISISAYFNRRQPEEPL